jgi:glutamyl-tRNA reductase
MPRVIDPDAATLPDVTLFSVDDLGDIARQSARRREREVPIVEEIARDEGRRAYTRFQQRRRYDSGRNR